MVSASSEAEPEEAFNWATAEFSRAWRSAIQRSYLALVWATSRSAEEAENTPTSMAAVETPIHSAAPATMAAAVICFLAVSTKAFISPPERT
jgi:hypothetical protein